MPVRGGPGGGVRSGRTGPPTAPAGSRGPRRRAHQGGCRGPALGGEDQDGRAGQRNRVIRAEPAVTTSAQGRGPSQRHRGPDQQGQPTSQTVRATMQVGGLDHRSPGGTIARRPGAGGGEGDHGRGRRRPGAAGFRRSMSTAAVDGQVQPRRPGPPAAAPRRWRADRGGRGAHCRPVDPAVARRPPPSQPPAHDQVRPPGIGVRAQSAGPWCPDRAGHLRQSGRHRSCLRRVRGRLLG